MVRHSKRGSCVIGAGLGLVVGLAACSSTDARSGETTATQDQRLSADVMSLAAIGASGNDDAAMPAGSIGALSFFADGTGAVGLIYPAGGETKVTIRAFDRLHALARGAKSKTYDVSIPSFPVGLNGQPWKGELVVQFDDDGTARAHNVQLVRLTGENTVAGDGGPFVTMAPSDTFVCTEDADCAKFGLPASYACNQNVCRASELVQIRQ